MTYIIILLLLIAVELAYFKVADHFNIIDKPNERSSHKRVVLRGGGIIFTIGLWIWCLFYGFHYPWLLAGVTLAAGVSFIDDIHSLPDSIRLIVQFAAMTMVLYPCIMAVPCQGLIKAALFLPALIVCVGATNIYNFMDGINGITGGYSIAVLVPLYLLNKGIHFIDESLLVVIGLSLLVFCFFNYRTKAKCFAGDVGSIGIALLLLFAIGCLIVKTGDITWLMLMLVYGIDGCLTIIHRIMLHENLGQAHRKHAYQLMANELKMKHVIVSTIYMCIQLIVSLIAVYLVPNNAVAHWFYLLAMIVLLATAYVLFMRKYYHLHAEYLRELKNEN